MSRDKSTAHPQYFHPDDPAGWLKPGESFLINGLDWAWVFVIYRDIRDFPGYCVGSNGMVWTCMKVESKGYRYGIRWVIGDNWKLLKLQLKRGRHLGVILRKGGDRKCYNRFVHVLVLEAFLGPCPPGMQSLHYNDVSSNNNLYKIRWGTPEENTADAFRNGRRPIGESHPQSKHSDDQIRKIREEYAAGGISQSALASKCKMTQPVMSAIITGRSRKDAGGPTSNQGRSPIKLTQAKADKMRAMVTDGMSIKEAAHRFGVRYPTAHSVIRGASWVSKTDTLM